jgi:hypothetical protein
MQVYHGTSAAKLKQIQSEGVDAPSYWTTDYHLALEYASSHGKGVVLAVELEALEFKANMAVAHCLFDNDDIEELPAEDNLEYSLEYLGGIVCHDRIWNFEVVAVPPVP